jgi:hypothetical protein
VFTPSGGGSGVLSVDGPMVDNTDPDNPIVNTSIQVTGSLTADNGVNYIQTASATYTDPSPVAGQGYVVTVVSGTATIDGVTYPTVGTIIKRYYNGSAWVNSIINPVASNKFIYQAIVSNQTVGTTLSGLRYFNITGFVTVAVNLSSPMAAYFGVAGTFSNFRFRTTGTQPASGSLVITVVSGSNVVALVDSSITVTVPASGVAQVLTSSNTLTIAAGDYVTIKAQNNASAASATIGDIYMEFTPL